MLRIPSYTSATGETIAGAIVAVVRVDADFTGHGGGAHFAAEVYRDATRTGPPADRIDVMFGSMIVPPVRRTIGDPLADPPRPPTPGVPGVFFPKWPQVRDEAKAVAAANPGLCPFATIARAIEAHLTLLPKLAAGVTVDG